MRPIRAVAVVAVAALLGLLVWDVAHQQSKGIAAKVDRGQSVAAPALDLPRLGGGPNFDLASHRGKVVVVNFWASWCYPACYEEAPVLEQNWRGYRERGVVVMGVDIQDKRDAAQKFVEDFGLTFPIAQDLKGTVSVDYGVYGVPETFFVDRQGRIRVKHVGAVTDDVFKATVDRLLAETPAR